MTRLLIPLLISLFLLSSCSPFSEDNQIKPVADGLSPKALYAKAEEQVKAGAIDQAINQYELILLSYPGSKYAIQARLDIAYNLYKQKKYDRAILELDKFIDKYPNIVPTPYAYYLKGVIAEEKSDSILDKFITDSAQRDVQSIRDAYGFYTQLIATFPDSRYSDDAEKKLIKLINILARHEFYVALYYTEISSHIAAINRSKFIIENFPNSASIPDSLNLMVYNYDQLNASKLAEDVRKILSSSYPNYSPSYSID